MDTAQRLRADAAAKHAQADRDRKWVRVGYGGVIALVALAQFFLAVNVTLFARQHGTPPWIAWLLDPLVSGVLILLLLGDQMLARYGVSAPGSARLTKYAAAAATLAMNIWAPLAGQDWPAVFLHAVVPVLVWVTIEVGPDYAARLSRAVAELAADADALMLEADRIDAADRAAVARAEADRREAERAEKAERRAHDLAMTQAAAAGSATLGQGQARGQRQGRGQGQLTQAAGSATLPGLVEVNGPVTLERWVSVQYDGGAKRVEVMRVGATMFGVSQETIKRRWDDARRAAQAVEDLGAAVVSQ